MNPLDYSKAVSEFWTSQGRALLEAQEQVAKALSESVQAAAGGKFPALTGVLPDTLSAEAEDLGRASKSLVNLWSAATTVCSRLATTLPSMSGSDGVIEATMRKMVDPRSWMGGTGEMDDFLSRMAEGPRFADLWEVERRYANVLRAWMTLRRRGLEHNAVVLEAWLQAGRLFTEQIAGRAGANGRLFDAKAALDLWVETANRQLLETQRSEAFLQTQAALIRATIDLHTAQQDLVEHFGKQYGFPTRTELDDVHRTVTELRREVRALCREQQKTAALSPKAQAARAALLPSGRKVQPRRRSGSTRTEAQS